jgi:3-oxoacyl-(acyl-carrier-protein) synthase
VTGRVVVTGMGVLAPNGHGLDAFEAALRGGRSGIRFREEQERLKLRCHVAGVPEGVDDETIAAYLSPDRLFGMNRNMIYATIAAVDCWRDAGLAVPEPGDETVDAETGAILGTILGSARTVAERLGPLTSAGRSRRLGSTMPEQVMTSNVSATVGGLLGLGGRVTTISSACATGTECVLQAYRDIRAGRMRRVLAGGSEDSCIYLWAGFDAMRLLTSAANDRPERASRPLSGSAAGFVPGSGAGVLLLESLESARERGAPQVYAEVLGGEVNSGGQRAGGTMTAPAPEGVVRCIRAALADAGVEPREVDLINGHLTGTMADPHEVRNWREALGVEPELFPTIQATKSLVGHAMGAAGAIETIAGILQLDRGFVHPSVNCEDLHPDLEAYAASVPHACEERTVDTLGKTSFGFGDVNACVFFRRWA